MRTPARSRLLSLSLIASLGVACTYDGPGGDIEGQDIRLTFLHTADWHSRLVPYDFAVGPTDERLGLAAGQGPYGGGARMAYLLSRERARAAERVLHIDSGDCFQGAPIFNFFSGEAEIRTLADSGLDAMVIGNHEFDRGGSNLARQLNRWATFPSLAANYVIDPAPGRAPGDPALEEIAKPFTIFNLRGLRVGLIGMANLSSMNSIYVAPNRLGITPLNTVEVAQFYVDLIRPMVDLVVVVSHLGLRDDEELVANTRGVDIVLGGHLHIVLNPPKTVRDLDGRPVLVVHSGAFMKYLGRLDVVVHQKEAGSNDWEVQSHRYQLFPVDASVPEDPRIAELIEPYELALDQGANLDLIVGYAPSIVRRFGAAGGDSPLGNLVADSIQLRLGVETDFGLTNTTGLRSDMGPGVIDVESMINVFPFDNTIATMFVSGREVTQIFDFVARRTASRGCATQAQIAGAKITLDCGGRSEVCQERAGGEPCAAEILIGGQPVSETAEYELATSDYLAGGGSGYRVLERNTTQNNTFIPMRDATIDRIRNGAPCTDNAPCTTDSDCGPNEACGCPWRARWDADAGMCEDQGECGDDSGHCVLSACVADVAAYHARQCENVDDDYDRERCLCDSSTSANEECPILPCIDARVGAVTDGRVELISP